MGKQALANKYRPKTWDDVTEQNYIKEILENQISNNTIKNAYLFCGGAGTGKTTTARIFANQINKGLGTPIEVDAASNNGVEQVRTIIDDAKFKPLDSDYKVFIMDECHMLSTGAWNAMLKLLEEPPKTTVFILCTTDPQKIPGTILSRVQRYDFQRISFEGIVNRLKYIIEKENEENKGFSFNGNYDEVPPPENEIEKISYNQEALEYIAKVADGGMRDAISLLDKCLAYNNDLTVENVVNILGISDYINLDKLLYAIITNNNKVCIDVIESVYRSGKDLKQFIKQFIQFVLDICKYDIYNDYNYIQIPNTIDLNEYLGVEYDDLLNVLNITIDLANQIKYEVNPKITIESKILLLCKGR